MSPIHAIIRAFAASIALFIFSGAVAACPFCTTSGQTYSERLAQADAAVLARIVKGASEVGPSPKTTYEIVEVLLQPRQELSKGNVIELERDPLGMPGGLFLLTGADVDSIRWDRPLEITETAFKYLKQAPSKALPASQRLNYFLPFLESPDLLVANDAYAEFSAAPYAEITLLADQFSAEKLRSWISDPRTSQNRIGFYGLVLGLCGTAEDAEFLKREILRPADGFRLGIDGIIAGYLAMTGDEGLALLEDAKLRDPDTPISETYAAMEAIRFMWAYGERIEKPRLQQAMRLLLFRPDVASLVITDLTRWEDWSIMDQLMELYYSPTCSDEQTKRSIVRYFLTMTKKHALKPEATSAKEADLAKMHLAELKRKDPQTFERAEKMRFLD